MCRSERAAAPAGGYLPAGRLGERRRQEMSCDYRPFNLDPFDRAVEHLALHRRAQHTAALDREFLDNPFFLVGLSPFEIESMPYMQVITPCQRSGSVHEHERLRGSGSGGR